MLVVTHCYIECTVHVCSGIMPYGMTWPAYLRFATCAVLAAAAGAQCVHRWYQPLKVLC